MKESKKKISIKQGWDDFKQEAKGNKLKTFVYFFLRILVVIVMIAELFNGNYYNVFLCILTLALFLIPEFVDKRLNIVLPNTLQIIILLFIFGAEILGEINEYYLIFERWDDLLHTINGFLSAAIGFSMIDILNRNEKVSFYLSPFFVAMVAFCFSMTIGVLWEFFEFGMDLFFRTDMQKDTILPVISSVLLNPDGKNIAIILPIEEMIVNGIRWDFGGYIDIGLYDTMRDLFVNFIGALSFSIIGYFYIIDRNNGQGQGKFMKSLIPRAKTKKEIKQSQNK